VTSTRTTPTSRRDQILSQAATLFAARGFHGVSVDELGAACGISGPALYRHFASKEAMLSEMLVSISAKLLEVGRERAAVCDPENALDELVRWHIDFALANRALIVVQDRDWDSMSETGRREVRKLQTAYIALWVKHLRALRSDLDPVQARARVQAVFGLLNSTPRSGRLPDADLRPLLQRMALASLHAE